MPYGTANVDVIQSSVANTPVQFNDGNGTQIGTLCRAWVNFDGTTSPGTIRASFNVSSITRNATGDYTVTFTTAFSDANYSWSFGGDATGTRLNTYGIAKTNAAVPTASAIRVQFCDDQSTNINPAYACVKIHR